MIFTLPLDAGLVALFLLACAGLGRRIMTAAGQPRAVSPAADLLLSIGAGLFIISYITFALGCLGLACRSVFLGVLSLAAWWGRRETAGFFSGLRGASFTALSRFEKVLLSVLLAAAVLNLLYNYCPPTAEDEISTYLGLPYRWAAAHVVSRLPEAGSVQYYPSGVLMHYLFLAAAGSIQTARLFHYVSGLLCLFGVYLVARRFLNRGVSLLAGAIFYTIPVVTSLSGVGNTDFGTLFYALPAVYSFLEWLRDKNIKRLTAAAIFAGAHAACKYTGFPMLLIFPALIIYEGRARLGRAVGRAAAFAAVAFSALAPYLIRNTILIGNPLYPRKLFSLNYHELMYVTNFKGESLAGLIQRIGDAGLGNVIWGVGPMFAAFLPFIFVFKVRDEDGRDISMLLFVIAALNFLLLFGAGISFHLNRHSLISFALLSVPVAGALEGIYSSLNIRRYLVSLLCVLFTSNLALPLYFGGKRLPVFFGLQSKRDYFDREYDIWERSFMVKYINDNLPEGSGIFFLGIQLAPQLNYPKHRVWGMDTFAPGFYGLGLGAALAGLEQKGIGYIVVLRDSFDEDADGILRWKSGNSGLPIKWFRPGFAEPVITRDNVTLYALKKPNKI